MSGRLLAWLLTAALAAALAAQTLRARDLIDANRILGQVERISVRLAGAGANAAPLYWANVKLLQRAERLAPVDWRLPLARGGQFLLLGRPEEALTAYRQGLAIEPRAELYLNLGRAQLATGDRAAAADSFASALTLAPRLRDEVPKELRPGSAGEGGGGG